MLQIRTNRRGYTQCNKCKKEIEYREDYFVNTDTGKSYHEKCVK